MAQSALRLVTIRKAISGSLGRLELVIALSMRHMSIAPHCGGTPEWPARSPIGSAAF